MQKLLKTKVTFEQCIGWLFAGSGILMMCVAGSENPDLEINIDIYVASSVTCLCGFILVWKDVVQTAVIRRESWAGSGGKYLGKFRLNDYTLEAYEREGENGCKQFRLVSLARFSPEREAAYIRYMVGEGLIEAWWPEMSNEIKEEADWAFFS